jgi:FkbM family methyltransferase
MIIKEKYVDVLIIFMIESDWSGGSILSGQVWEPHISKFFERNLTKDSILADVGSNYGWHSIKSSSLCKEIYSFEPQKLIHDLQLSSITKNNISNIHLYNCGVGNINETKNMAPINYESSVHIGDLSVGDGGEEIEIKTLDTIIPNGFDFIKIDVQGYEKFVLEGGINNLINHKPTIVIEVEEHQLRKFGYGCTDLFNVIKDLGYVIYFLDYHYPSDHVCVHKDKLNDFIAKNAEWIQPLTENSYLNNNLGNGITEKIVY